MGASGLFLASLARDSNAPRGQDGAMGSLLLEKGMCMANQASALFLLCPHRGSFAGRVCLVGLTDLPCRVSGPERELRWFHNILTVTWTTHDAPEPNTSLIKRCNVAAMSSITSCCRHVALGIAAVGDVPHSISYDGHVIIRSTVEDILWAVSYRPLVHDRASLSDGLAILGARLKDLKLEVSALRAGLRLLVASKWDIDASLVNSCQTNSNPAEVV